MFFLLVTNGSDTLNLIYNHEIFFNKILSKSLIYSSILSLIQPKYYLFSYY